MGQQWDRSYDGQGERRGPGHTVRAGFGPQGQHPREIPPRTPPQFRPEAPPRQDGARPTQPQYTPGPQYHPPAPAPAADPWAASAGGSWQPPPPAGSYAPRHYYQRPYQPAGHAGPYRVPQQGAPHLARNVMIGIGALFAVIVIAVAASSGHGTASTLSAGSGTAAPAGVPASTAPAGTTSEMQALAAAQDYLSDGQGFSRQGLIGQLDSPDGDNFPVADATWAVDHSGANWDDQAVDCAKGYMSDGEGFSRQGLIQQLTSSYGNQFTQAQAEYAANAVGL